ncbi:transposase [Aminipila terrae]|uniref:transposase n=1 Tax=Aminipila terrae TaxID=2697030 RepID=UPI001FAC11B6|nr:transposase [Aminipila terrae]
MRYSYEFKRKCVEMYHRGTYPETPKGISEWRFHKTVRHWVRLEEAQGPTALQHQCHNRVWAPEEKLRLVSQVIAGKAYAEIAIANGINSGRCINGYKNIK